MAKGAIQQQLESLTKLQGVAGSVDTLVALLAKTVGEASSVEGGVPIDAVVAPAEAASAAVAQLKEGIRVVHLSLKELKEAEEMAQSAPAVTGIPGVYRAPSDVPRTPPEGSDGWTQPEMDVELPEKVSAEADSEDILAIVPAPQELDPYLFYPSWTSKLTWDLTVMLIVVLDALVLPFQLSFKHGMPEDAFDVFWFYTTLIVFSSDLVVTFNTALPKDDDGAGEVQFEMNRKQIARVYLRGWFTIDFVSTFPWSKVAELVSDGEGGAMVMLTKLLKMLKFARIIRLMKMLRAKKIKDIWEKIECAIGSIAIVQCMMLLRILLMVMAICHWFACIFWIVGSPVSLVTELLPASVQTEFSKVPHWTTIRRSFSPELGEWSWSERPLPEKYLFCFYWTLGVMRTMPAEVTPVNLTERVFVLLFMFFALSAFAISVASLTQAYFKINERSRSFGDEMFFIRMHLSRLKMDDSSQRRIKDYLNHLFERRRILAKEANLLDKMPEVLKQEVHGSKIHLQLRKLTVLQDLARSTIKEICDNCETFDLMPEQTICNAGEISQATWIVVTGVVSAKDSAGRMLNFDKPLQVIDEDCLMGGEGATSELTVTTQTCCEVVKIDKQSFVKIVAAKRSSDLHRPKKNGNGVSSAGGGPQKIDVQEATDNSPEENGAASAAAAALSA